MELTTISRRLRAASAAALLLVAAAVPAQTIEKNPETKKEVLERVTSLLTQRAYVPGLDFEKWPEFLEAESKKIDEAKSDDEFARAVNEALHKFGASHIALSTPKSADQRRTSSVVGIGITSQVTEDGSVLVVRVVPDAPAAKAGLVPGDTIIEVDGQKAEGIKGIPGEEGTQVKIKVRHQDGKSDEYTLTRRQFSTRRAEELEWVDKDTAKLSVYTFDLSYDHKNVAKLMEEVHSKKAKNLILDLRDNGGGAVINLQHLLGFFLESETGVGTFISRGAVKRFKEETGGLDTDLAAIAQWSADRVRPSRVKGAKVFKGNVVVLVNQFSGSASEICAAGLRDTIGATVVGTKSAGAVLVSVIVPASNGFTLQYPLADYVTIKGQRLEGGGVVPDVEATDPKFKLPGVPDEAIEKAVLMFAKKAKQEVRGSGN